MNAPHLLKPNVAEISAHLHALFPPEFVHHFPDAQIEIIYGSPGVFTVARWFSAFDPKSIAEFAEMRNAEGDNIYVGAALRKGPVPESGRANTKQNYLAAQYAWCEYDGAGDYERIVAICRDKQLEPAIIATTGTVPHLRQHLYFRIKGGVVATAEQGAVNETLRGLLGSDDVKDPIRIMRLGGCINYPTEKKHRERGYVAELVTVKITQQPREYSIEELIGNAPSRQSSRANGSRGYNESEEKAAPTVESFFKDVNALALTRLSHWVKPLFGDFVRFYPSTGSWRTAPGANKVLPGRAHLEEAIDISQRIVWDYGFEKPSNPISLVMDYRPQKSSLVPTTAQEAAFWLCERMNIAPEALGWGTRESRSAKDAEYEEGYGFSNADAPPSGADDPTLLPTGDKQLDAMNVRYFVVREGGKTLVGTFDNEHGRQTLVLMGFTDFRNLHMHKLVAAGKNVVPLGAWWLQQSKRRQYSGLCFHPGNDARVIDDKLNLWRGWSFQPVKGDWSKLREHIWVVVASRNKEVFDYVMNWLAWCVQHPDKRAEVVLVMQGKRGAGKGTVANAMCKLFGQHALQISSAEHLVGRFNGHLRDTVLLFADEAYWPGNKGAEGTIKRLVTEPTIFIEAKGRDGIEVPNLLHVMMASNEDWVVPAGERERRYFVLKVNDDKLQDHAWFKGINEQLDDGGYEAMLQDLLHHDLGDFHPRRLPKCNDLTSPQAPSLGPLDSWWCELLEIGTLTGCDPGAPHRAVSNRYEEKVVVGISDRWVTRFGLYDQARTIEPRLRNMSEHRFGDFLREQGCDNSRKVMRRRGWTFPDLSVCRKKWEARFAGWKWRNPHLKQWQIEDADEEGAASEANAEPVPF